jgi:hypothetical protein
LGLSETPVYIEKLFEREDSVLSVRLAGVGRVEFLVGGRAIVKAIFSDMFILENYNDVCFSRCRVASLLPKLRGLGDRQ